MGLINFQSLCLAVKNFKKAAGWAFLFTDGDKTTTFNTDAGPKKSFAYLQEEWENRLNDEFLAVNMNVVVETQDFVVGPQHMNQLVRINSATPVVVTLPKDSGFNQRFFCVFTRIGQGDVSFTGDVDVIIDSRDGARRIFSRFQYTALHYVDVDRYQIAGDLY